MTSSCHSPGWCFHVIRSACRAYLGLPSGTLVLPLIFRTPLSTTGISPVQVATPAYGGAYAGGDASVVTFGVVCSTCVALAIPAVLIPLIAIWNGRPACCSGSPCIGVVDIPARFAGHYPAISPKTPLPAAGERAVSIAVSQAEMVFQRLRNVFAGALPMQRVLSEESTSIIIFKSFNRNLAANVEASSGCEAAPLVTLPARGYRHCSRRPATHNRAARIGAHTAFSHIPRIHSPTNRGTKPVRRRQAASLPLP